MQWAVASRVWFWGITLIAFHWGTTFDYSGHQLMRNNLPSDSIVPLWLTSVMRWDSIHFYSVASNGYQLEHQLAFFPGFPGLMYLVAKGLGNFLFNFWNLNLI
jgi:hypothetical protein